MTPGDGYLSNQYGKKSMFDLATFIEEYVTKRNGSMFISDMEENRDALSSRISGKSVCVVGGAGSIGSSFIKALLPFEPASLVVVDINENALTVNISRLRSKLDEMGYSGIIETRKGIGYRII